MKAVERYRIIETVVRWLSDLSLSEVNAILKVCSAGLEFDNPWWESTSKEDKVNDVRILMAEYASDTALESLRDFLPDAGQAESRPFTPGNLGSEDNDALKA